MQAVLRTRPSLGRLSRLAVVEQLPVLVQSLGQQSLVSVLLLQPLGLLPCQRVPIQVVLLLLRALLWHRSEQVVFRCSQLFLM